MSRAASEQLGLLKALVGSALFQNDFEAFFEGIVTEEGFIHERRGLLRARLGLRKKDKKATLMVYYRIFGGGPTLRVHLPLW